MAVLVCENCAFIRIFCIYVAEQQFMTYRLICDVTVNYPDL